MTVTEKISIRLARDEDIGALADLAARAFRDAFEADNHASDIDSYLRNSLSVESVQAEFDDANNIFLIAYFDGNEIPAGYAKLSTATQHPDVGDQTAIEIERLYADKPAIGQGIGAALMRTCLDKAEALGCRAIWLGVWERNVRAIRFYERWKFETVGARPFTLGSDSQNDLVMTRKLSI